MHSLLLTILSVLMLSACGGKAKESGDVSADGYGMSDRQVMTDPDMGVTGQEIGGDQYGPVPGSQQDLVVNVGDRVFFDYDQYDLRPEARATLERQAEWMRQYPGVHLIIQGHTDERGTREYNLALGEKRASSVRNYMVALGITADRIEVVSFGKERPAVLGSTPSAWSQNRRSVSVIK